jgi:hypothetical protein
MADNRRAVVLSAPLCFALSKLTRLLQMGGEGKSTPQTTKMLISQKPRKIQGCALVTFPKYELATKCCDELEGISFRNVQYGRPNRKFSLDSIECFLYMAVFIA